uniref:Sterol O-acyltransferase n=1 Tax=Rhodotorula toruloides TaxID=5286 RepID=A0A2Z6EYU7_RHOTO|nr:sterol O-acyltransferase [Rhodotorula toruloides]
MASLDPPLPGPANLIDDALRHPNSAPPIPPESAPPSLPATGTHPRGQLSTASSYSSDVSTREGTPDLPAGQGVTTTITTVTGKGGKAVTQTLTHVGASSVDARFSSSTKSITLRPITARGGDPKKIKVLRSRRTHFAPRTSHFDRHNQTSASDPFRGLYTLFWIGGWGGEWRFAALISRDGWVLAVSDAVLVSASLLCVPYAKLLVHGWIRYRGAGVVIQHICQTLYLAIAIRWTFHRNWPWVQSGFMTLHALSMLMKIHSYCSLNGELSERRREMIKGEGRLEIAVEELGGRRKVEREAREEWERMCAESQTGKEGDAQRGEDEMVGLVAQPSTDASTSALSSEDEAVAAAALRHRQPTARRRSISPSASRAGLTSSSSSQPAPSRAGLTSSSSAQPAPSRPEEPQEGVETLTWHPSDRVSKLAIAICEAKDLLTSNGKKPVTFPENVTFANFIDYLLVPTLVYELEYPRTDSIRPLYILEKTLATFGTFSILVLIVDSFILPVTSRTDTPLFGFILDLALPFTLAYLLIFYVIFEGVCNGFAELTRFADRNFFDDWWNSCTFDEFSRKWNRPVHAFLLRHVYAETMASYKLSKLSAAFVTFLFSACVHELVMAVVTKKLRLYLFSMQMAQLPLIMVGRAKIFRQYPALGNLFFWLALLSGFPLLGTLYLRY